MQFSSKNILIILAIFILAIFSFYLINYFPKSLSSQTQTESTLQERDLCAEFSKVEGEISCQKAKEIALMEYPGEVKYIEKKKVEIPSGVLPDIEMVEKEVWLVGVNLEESLKIEGGETEYQSIEVFILRDSGEIQINSLLSGEI